MADPQGPGGQDWSDMKDKLTSAKGPDRLMLIGGAVFVISSFLPWYGISAGAFSVNVSGWDSGGLAVIAIILGILATILAAMLVVGAKPPVPEDKLGVVGLALGAGAFVFVLLRFLTEMSLTRYGLFIALVASGALAFGAYQKFSASK